jgi:inhibitor of KinA sporulation pathway (predicted exonuclease)
VQEIIEFSAVLWSTATHEVEDTFQVYVKPLVHPVLTPFCHHLTGIHQEWVDNGTCTVWIPHHLRHSVHTRLL